MTKLKIRTVREQLCDDYKAVDLERVFREYGFVERSLSRWDLRKGIRQKAQKQRDIRNCSDRPKDSHNDFNFLDGAVKPKYQKVADRAFEDFIEDCLRYDILRETQHGKYELVMVDPTVFESERNGIRIECRWAEPYTMYRHRMNTSGRIDIEANGDPAIDGKTYQDPLTW